MIIREKFYSFMLLSIFLGGLFITNLAGLWQASGKNTAGEHQRGGRHQVTAVE